MKSLEDISPFNLYALFDNYGESLDIFSIPIKMPNGNYVGLSIDYYEEEYYSSDMVVGPDPTEEEIVKYLDAPWDEIDENEAIKYIFTDQLFKQKLMEEK